jgi:hypothetical protein
MVTVIGSRTRCYRYSQGTTETPVEVEVEDHRDATPPNQHQLDFQLCYSETET